MKQSYILIFSLLSVLFFSCGTGPWVTKKKNFELYKQVINDNNTNQIRTDGIYFENGRLKTNICFRKFIIFYQSGYCLTGNFENSKWSDSKDSILKDILKRKRSDYGTYLVRNDSIFIDEFEETNRLYYRWVDNFEGTLINDTLIKFHFQRTTLGGYPDMQIDIAYTFFSTDQIPPYNPTSWYLEKKWFKQNINKSRKTL